MTMDLSYNPNPYGARRDALRGLKPRKGEREEMRGRERRGWSIRAVFTRWHSARYLLIAPAVLGILIYGENCVLYIEYFVVAGYIPLMLRYCNYVGGLREDFIIIVNCVSCVRRDQT